MKAKDRWNELDMESKKQVKIYGALIICAFVFAFGARWFFDANYKEMTKMGQDVLTVPQSVTIIYETPEYDQRLTIGEAVHLYELPQEDKKTDVVLLPVTYLKVIGEATVKQTQEEWVQVAFVDEAEKEHRGFVKKLQTIVYEGEIHGLPTKK